MTLLVRAPDRLVPERRYILDVVLSEWLGFDYQLVLEARSNIAIRLLGDSQERELQLVDGLFATPQEDWLTERSMPVGPLPRLDAGGSGVPDQWGSPAWPTSPLPILFGKPDPLGQFWRESPNEVGLSVDVFGSVFFLLTRYEEVVVGGRDEHERFRASATLASAEGFVDRPIVEEYVDLLWLAMLRLWPGLCRRDTSFRLLLTHDVDRPWATLGHTLRSIVRGVGADVVLRRDPVLAATRIRSAFDARSGRVDRDPFNSFGLLMDTSERHGLRSTFYFMAGATDRRFDGSYRIADPAVMSLLKEVKQRGHEVGLHASYDTFRSVQQMRTELESLKAACRAVGFDQPAWGVRQHFLRFETPATWRNQAAAGLDHDSTVGFAEVNGFRAGTSREYPVFDVIDRTRLAIRERPLIVMDAASDEYLARDFDGAAARAEALVAQCRRHNGDAVLLYHNSSLPGAAERAHYRELIEALVHPH